MIFGAILGVIAVICRMVLWSLVRQYIFRARLDSGSGWRGLRFSGRRGYQSQLGPAQAPDLYAVDMPGRAPLGRCWECGRKVKPSQAVCFACGAAQVQSSPTGGYAHTGAPARGFGSGQQAAPEVQAAPQYAPPQYAPPQYAPPQYAQPPYAEPSRQQYPQYPEYPQYPQPPYPPAQQFPDYAPFPQYQRDATWGYPPDGRS